jgi:alkaline phosphatase D
MSAPPIDRRGFLETAARAAGFLAAAPALVQRDGARPSITHGTASGDVSRSRAIVWSRTDRPARMIVEWDTTASFSNRRLMRGSVARDATGFTARADLSDLPPGQRIVYRVRFEDLMDSRAVSEPVEGSFLSGPDDRRDVTLAWSADTCGQGWGINTDWGGLRMFETIRRLAPDFFIHCGDTIYADGPLPSEMKLADGSLWRNVVTPAKSKVADTLDEFRNNYLYNLTDEHVRRFNAEVPQLALWDDHEVRNNWNPASSLADDARYTTRNIAQLASRGRQAFLEHMPVRIGSGAPPRIFRSIDYGPLLEVFSLDLRTYRAANSANRQPAPGAATTLAGAAQIEWLERSLATSLAMWKVIASDLPLGLAVTDGDAFEAIANGDGPPLGREFEIVRLLRFIQRRGIRNIIWVTADVHYAAAHHYDPARAQFREFLPFWEFVAGPLHAGTGRPVALDNTFGPEVRFISVPATPPASDGPASGLQFFGTVAIRGSSGVMTVQLRNLGGEVLYGVDLQPAR